MKQIYETKGILLQKMPVEERGRLKIKNFLVQSPFDPKDILQFQLLNDDISKLDSVYPDERITVKWQPDTRKTTRGTTDMYFTNLQAIEIF